jgi:hypothetical protein
MMVRSIERSVRLATVALVVGAAVARAQPVTSPLTNANRPALEQQFRERAAKVAKDRIGLTDGQMQQLEQSNARFAPRLNQLAAQERDTRQQLRLEMTAGGQANQQHVNELLDTSLRLQKQRIALVEEEQRDLARFMTPVQRARYIALQQQFRRRAQELAAQNGAQKPGMGLDQKSGNGQQRVRPALKKKP